MSYREIKFFLKFFKSLLQSIADTPAEHRRYLPRASPTLPESIADTPANHRRYSQTQSAMARKTIADTFALYLKRASAAISYCRSIAFFPFLETNEVVA